VGTFDETRAFYLRRGGRELTWSPARMGLVSGDHWWAGILAIALSAALASWLAYACLDEFWHRLLNWFRWS